MLFLFGMAENLMAQEYFSTHCTLGTYPLIEGFSSDGTNQNTSVGLGVVEVGLASLTTADSGDCLTAPSAVAEENWFTVSISLDYSNPLESSWNMTITVSPNKSPLVRFGEVLLFSNYGVPAGFPIIQDGCTSDCSTGPGKVQITANGAEITSLSAAPTKTGTTYRPLLAANNIQTFNVGCVDSTSHPVACQLTITLTPNSYSGGHNHDDTQRPPGELICGMESLEGCEANELPPIDQGTSLTLRSIIVTTDANGDPAQLEYVPPPIGGDITMNLSATSVGQSTTTFTPINNFILHIRTAFISTSSCTDPTSGLASLCPMPSGLEAGGKPYYILTGQTTTNAHPNNHYGTTGFLRILDSIARLWYNLPIPPLAGLPPQPLAINDMSLVDGGLFDLEAVDTPAKNWNTPHAYHRWGDEADVGSSGNGDGMYSNSYYQMPFWIPVNDRQYLWAILRSKHYGPIVENACPNPTNYSGRCSHWHIQSTNP
jgi:hypothetical protein